MSSIGLASNNPILANITDYLIEEASAEEEELLGKNNDLEDGEEGEDGNSVTRDDELLKVQNMALLGSDTLIPCSSIISCHSYNDLFLLGSRPITVLFENCSFC